ncbi:tripartite tricarboxylate transporter substrate binding protein [Falsiroseomonas bella]|uniref:Tripartite tricarboxylate transporter substrate binding protein n=1 Tax=Falsiroseomonas bella TaxID=2184016 RepID=A0A317FGV0_9PROT|nr:tripartite tricarboxylate transporter substrate-binding protein [Falsiroseomonas bella]PWS37257.1 tripartite tricarboxylate transporter substrate binding protein [Falsiroseomonas bella]
MTSTRITPIGRRTLLAASAGVALAAPAARAQGFPERPITLLVPFATGGYNDRLARAMAPFVQRHIGQPVTVVNRPGGATVLGNTFFLQQPDDGYMMMVHSAAPFIPVSIITRNARYKAEDFWMINLPSRDATLMACAPDKPIRSIDEVVASLKRDPRSLSVGLQPASADLINFALFCQGHGIDRSRVRVVTYDGGGPARNATAGGVVDVGLVGGEGFLPIKDRIRPLLMFTDEKNSDYPDTPILSDHAKAAGFEPQFVDGSQRGFVVAKRFVDAQPDRYRILLQAVEKASKDPECISTLAGQQLATTWYGPEASNRAYLSTSRLMERYGELLTGRAG